MFNDSPDKLPALVKAHHDAGTVAMLTTFISDEVKKIPEAVEAVRNYRSTNGFDHGVAGLHLEGPFLNESRKGIHPASALQKGVMDVFTRIDMGGLGALMITLAPEIAAHDDIQKLAQNGVIVAAGHSTTNAATLHKAKMAGLKGVTHLYNGMGGLSARAPGLAGLALADDDLTCGIICDDAHVDTAMMRVAFKAKPPGTLYLVSDAMPPAGQHPQTDFMLGADKIFVRNNRCENADGTLAGCALTLFECVRIAVQKIGIPLATALEMASRYPATFIGIEKDFGSLDHGCHASVIAFDANMRLERIISAR